MASRYWIGDSGNWTDTAHWSASSGGVGGAAEPTSSDDVYFDANSFTLINQTVSIGSGTANCKNMNWTGIKNGIVFSGTSSGILNIYGSLTLSNNMSSFICGYIYLLSTGSETITTNGATIGDLSSNLEFRFNNTGTWTLQDELNTYYSFIYLTKGTFDANSKNIYSGLFASLGSNVRTLTLGSSKLTCNSFLMGGTNLTLNSDTSTITTLSFTGAGKTYYNLLVDRTPVFIMDSNTFNAITINPGKTLKLLNGTTQTVSDFSANGNTDQGITIQSTLAGSQATISKGSGTVSAKWCTIQDISATGGATFNAYYCTDAGNNLGWNFISRYMTLVSGYIPTYYADKNPDGTGGGQIDELNYISSAFKETFSGNATGTTFYMSFGNLTTGDNIVLVNNVTLASGGATAGFSVNYVSGYFTLTTAATSGVGNVEVTTHKPVLEATCIANCTIACTHGEGNDTNVYLTGNRSFPARVWWCDTLDPTYFPATSYADVGVTNDKMMGMLPHGNTLLLMKYRSIHGLVGVPPNNSIMEMYDGEGLIATDSLKLADGYPTFMSQRGVVQLQSENSKYKLELISEDVNGIPGLRNGIITETLANRELAFAWVFQNKYFLWLNGTIWVYQYNLKRTEQNRMIYPWIPWKTFTNTACFSEKDNYMYFGDTGNLYKFDPTINTDNGTAINSFWLGKKIYPANKNTVNAYYDVYWNVGMSSSIATSTVNFTLYVSGVSSTKSETFTPSSSYMNYPVRHPFSYRSNSIQYMIQENSTSGGFSLEGLNFSHMPVRKII